MTPKKASQFPHILEITDVNVANEMLETGLYRQPIFSESRGYILFKKAKEAKK